MALITKEVTTKWSTSNMKHFIEKGYIYTKIGDKFIVRVEDLSKGSSCKIEVQCEKCGIITIITYERYLKRYKNGGEYYCRECYPKLEFLEYNKSRLKKSISLGDYLIANLSKEKSDEFFSRWDYEKNNCSPFDICYGSQKKFWFKCLFCKDHVSEEKSIRSQRIIENNDNLQCQQCNTIFYQRPDLIKYFVNIEDSKNYTIGSGVKVNVKCPICNNIQKIRIKDLCRREFSCQNCSDGYSFPNKFCFNVLNQLNIKFKPEYKPKWANGRQYDFYFKKDNQSYIIEMDGNFHYIDNPFSGQTKEESNIIDTQKDIMAEKNHIKVFRIESRTSELEYMKNNFFNSKLASVLDLSFVDWNQCFHFALSSFVHTTCDLWGIYHDINNIANLTKLSRGTIQKYLKKGSIIGLCDYDAKEEHKKALIKGAKVQSIKIICLNTYEIFETITLASKKYNIGISSIICCAKGIYSYGGKDPITGEKLRWMYYDKYLNEQEAS